MTTRSTRTREPASPRPTSPRFARPDASMSLLLQAMEEPLDPGYAAAAHDRSEGARRRSRGRALGWGLAAVVAGVLTTTAVESLRQPEPSAARARAVLEREVEERTARLDSLSARLVELEADVASEQQRLSSPGEADSLEPVARAAGGAPVEGPGVELLVDDTGGDEDRERVYDRDLQLLVNGLWAAGAEAVAVNDQRVTTLTAIRSAGEAVLVGFRPLTPPYVVEALGDPVELQAAFVAGPGGTVARSLQENYGIRTSLSRVDSVEIPAAEALVLRYATSAAPGDVGSPSNAPSAEGEAP